MQIVKLCFVLNIFLIMVQCKPRRNIPRSEMPFLIIHTKPVCWRCCYTEAIKLPCSIDKKDFETCKIQYTWCARLCLKIRINLYKTKENEEKFTSSSYENNKKNRRTYLNVLCILYLLHVTVL